MSTQTISKNNQPAGKPAFDPWLLWVAFRRHWAWVIPAGMVSAIASALVVWYLFVPEYEAIHILEANRDYVLSQGLAVPSRDLAKSERTLISNAIVLDPVLADGSLKSAPSLSNPLTADRNIRDRIKVGNAGTDHLLTISYRDTDKEAAAKVCNAIVESYLKQRRSFDDRRMGNVEQWLVQPIEQWTRNVESLRNNLAELTKASNGYDPFKEARPLESGPSKLVELRGDLAELEAEEVVVNARIKAIQYSSESASEAILTPDPQRVQAFIDSDRDLQQLRAKLADAESKVRAIEYKEQQSIWSSRYKGLKEEVVTLTEQLNKKEALLRTQALDSITTSDREEFQIKHQAALGELQLRLVDLQARRDSFTSEYEKEKERLEELGGETAEMFFAREDYEQAFEILAQLKGRLNNLRTERGRGSSIQTVAEAKPPSWPIEEVPIKKIGMAGGATLLLPFLLAVLVEFRLKRITNVGGIEANQLAPVVGEIARIPSGVKRSQKHRLFEESVDSFRANLLFRLEGIQTIAVASAMPAEGKSNVTSQLAVSLAKYSEERVLIVDSDLRSPDQHELFGLELGPGLSKLLRGRATLDECIDQSLGDLVHVLPAGELKSNPHSLLTKKNLDLLFQQLRVKYRYIVVDTAPILPAAESLAVAAACDATLICAMRDVSRSEHLKRTFHRLETSGANVIGTVFSGVPTREYAYRYGHYRYAGN